MGNTGNSAGGHLQQFPVLLLLEEPLNLESGPNETLFAELAVEEEVHEIAEWPSAPIIIAPPEGQSCLVDELLRVVFVLAPSAEEWRNGRGRNVGEILVPRSSLEWYQQPVLQLWLGIIDPKKAPKGRLPSTAEAKLAFESCLELATVGSSAKVCLTIAIADPNVLTGQVEVEDHFNRLMKCPPMQAFLHASDIIRSTTATAARVIPKRNAKTKVDDELYHRGIQLKFGDLLAQRMLSFMLKEVILLWRNLAGEQRRLSSIVSTNQDLMFLTLQTKKQEGHVLCTALLN